MTTDPKDPKAPGKTRRRGPFEYTNNIPKHRGDWKLIGHGDTRALVLAVGIDWNDLVVRVEIRDDARRLSRSLGCTIKIMDQDAHILDTISKAPA